MDEVADDVLLRLLELIEVGYDIEDDDRCSVSIAECRDKQSCTFLKFWSLNNFGGDTLFALALFSSFKVVVIPSSKLSSNILDDPASSSFVRNGAHCFKNVPIVPA